MAMPDASRSHQSNEMPFLLARKGVLLVCCASTACLFLLMLEKIDPSIAWTNRATPQRFLPKKPREGSAKVNERARPDFPRNHQRTTNSRPKAAFVDKPQASRAFWATPRDHEDFSGIPESAKASPPLAFFATEKEASSSDDGKTPTAATAVETNQILRTDQDEWISKHYYFVSETEHSAEESGAVSESFWEDKLLSEHEELDSFLKGGDPGDALISSATSSQQQQQDVLEDSSFLEEKLLSEHEDLDSFLEGGDLGDEEKSASVSQQQQDFPAESSFLEENIPSEDDDLESFVLREVLASGNISSDLSESEIRKILSPIYDETTITKSLKSTATARTVKSSQSVSPLAVSADAASVDSETVTPPTSTSKAIALDPGSTSKKKHREKPFFLALDPGSTSKKKHREKPFFLDSPVPFFLQERMEKSIPFFLQRNTKESSETTINAASTEAMAKTLANKEPSVTESSLSLGLFERIARFDQSAFHPFLPKKSDAMDQSIENPASTVAAKVAASIDRSIYDFNTNLVGILYKIISALYPTTAKQTISSHLSPLLGTEYNQIDENRSASPAIFTLEEPVKTACSLRFEKFYLFETVARIPYFAYLSVMHAKEDPATLGAMRTHYAQADNEIHHMQIMEVLCGTYNGGRRKSPTDPQIRLVDQFLAHSMAFCYYWFVVLVFLWNEQAAYHLNEVVEEHAYQTYDELLILHEDELRSLPVPKIAREYYEDEFQKNPQLFDAFCNVAKNPTAAATKETARIHHSHRNTNQPHELHSLYDVFLNIRDDEREHWMTLCNLVQYNDLAAVDETMVQSTHRR